jgi:two-component system, NtrC family, sensor histidine kinase HydH
MDAPRFQIIQQYVEFTPDCALRLQRFLALARPELPLVVEDFYLAISRDPGASRAITGGQAQVERLTATLNQWLVSLLQGPHDETYVASRNRIGQVHVRINLSQEYMLTAMNRLRIGLLRIAGACVPPAELQPTSEAIHRALDLELALMLDTYRVDSAARIDATARLAAVGQVAASIGHELRNPLGVVESSLYLLTQRLNKLALQDPVLDKHTARMQEQLRSCSATITSLLEMVRDVPLSRTRFELEELLVECLQRTPPAAGVDVQFALPTKLLVYADRDQINAVLSNLLRNAFEAISTTPEKVVRLHASEAAGGVELIVEDSGIGVDAAHRSSIFEVLFTTRAKGTGLGLALCKKIIERHGGEISLLPSQQRGARFRLWLPPAPVSSRENGPHGET